MPMHIIIKFRNAMDKENYEIIQWWNNVVIIGQHWLSEIMEVAHVCEILKEKNCLTLNSTCGKKCSSEIKEK